MTTSNVPRNFFTLNAELDQAGINSRFLRVETDFHNHTITISRGSVPIVARRYMAKKIMADVDHRVTAFYHNGRLTTCVRHIDEHKKRIGNSYCSITDEYDQMIGDAIAYQRARYGKVLDTDLLG